MDISSQTNELLKPKNTYNNPGNIETGQNFAGEIGDYSDGRFAEFDSPEMGMRALAMDLNSKLNEFDGDVLKMLEKYAPYNENKTIKYSNFVSNELGKSKITFEDMPKLMSAVIKFENQTIPGMVNYYLDDSKKMETALKLAFKDDKTNRQIPSDYSFEEAKKFAGLQ